MSPGRLDFDTLLDYALDNRLYALIEEICEGWAIPAFEQPCWDCHRMRFFRRLYIPDGQGGVVFHYWFEQCCVRHPEREGAR